MVILATWVLTRQRQLAIALFKSSAVGAVALLCQVPYLAGSADMSDQEGAITLPTLRTLGGPVVLSLRLLGVGAAVTELLRGRSTTVEGRPLTATAAALCGLLVSLGGYMVFASASAVGWFQTIRLTK